MGIGFSLVLMVLGGIREFLGQGTLFYQAHLLLGEGARGFGLDLGESFHGALLAILPPGAFIGLGLLIALKNIVDKRVARFKRARVEARASQPPADGAPSAA
jgi:electron transport complex protein RnfE